MNYDQTRKQFLEKFALLLFPEVDPTRTQEIKEGDQREGYEQSTLLTGESPDTDQGQAEVKVKVTSDKKVSSSVNRCCMLFLDSFVTLRRGWKIYIRQKILFAGLGLAALYMTVLGFDGITAGEIHVCATVQ